MAFLTLQGTSGSSVDIPVNEGSFRGEPELVADIGRTASGRLRAAVTARKKRYTFETTPLAAGDLLTFLWLLEGTFATLDGDAFASTSVFVEILEDVRVVTPSDNNLTQLRIRLAEV